MPKSELRTLARCHRFRKPPFSSVHTAPKNTLLKKSKVWRPFSKSSGFGYQKHHLRVNGSRIQRKKAPFSKISGYVSTAPQPWRRQYKSVGSHTLSHSTICATKLGLLLAQTSPNLAASLGEIKRDWLKIWSKIRQD